MPNFVAIFQALQLLLSIATEVHAVQASLPGAPGAEKSQAVIDKVAPAAAAIGAAAPHVQAIIDSSVALFKAVGAFHTDPGPG